jgi:hypothetical protein
VRGDEEDEEPARKASGTERGLSPKVKEFVYSDRLCDDASMCAGLEAAYSECSEARCGLQRRSWRFLNWASRMGVQRVMVRVEGGRLKR